MLLSLPANWLRLIPDRLVIGLLPLEGFLLLSEWFQWLSFDQHKGWTVLIALACAGVTILMMLLWLLAALLFRWRFQYSLRSLFVLTVAVAIPCSWLATEMRWARRQRKAVDAIEKVHGIVEYDYQVKGRVSFRAPTWLRNVLGEDFFNNVVGVGVMWGAADSWLENLDELNSLESLQLNCPTVSDAGLEHLGKLQNLRLLELINTEVTDAGLKRLRGSTNLETLDLGNTKVTDSGLQYLSGLTNLQSLGLHGTKVMGIGLEYLKGLNEFGRLDLSNTKVTDAGMHGVGRLTSLQILDLGITEVTDAGLRNLAELKNLEYLALVGTKVTDEGLKYLKAMKKLHNLELQGSRVTDDGVKKLQQELPNCTIEY